MSPIQIRIDDAHTILEDKDRARDLRRRKLLPALKQKQPVVLDFAGVDVATQSFVHALISEAVRRYGDLALELIEFRNCTPAVQQIVSTVVAYTLIAAEQAGEERRSGDGSAIPAAT
jgi:STAS-like domain of unknown function (DUF4325)